MKKKLTKKGIQYFDAGGQIAAPITSPVAPSQPVMSGSIGGALTAQNGYNAQLAPTQQTNYGGLISQAAQNSLNGVNGVNANIGNQNALAQALLLQSQGGGPNPALTQLNQTTGQNVNNQAALMAGQRGAGSNPGLLARQIAMNGAQTQQNAVGQAATLQAQQQLAAEQGLSGLYGNIGNEQLGEQGVNNQLFGTASGAQNAQNNTNVTNYADTQGINQKTAAANAAASNQTQGGIFNAIGGVLGGLVSPITGALGLTGASAAPAGSAGAVTQPAVQPAFAKGGTVKYPSHLKGIALLYHPMCAGGTPMAAGGKVPVMLSPGEVSVSPEGEAKKVPGKAKVKGDSLKNDVVPAKLEAGGVVIPRSIVNSDDPIKNATKFLVDHLKKQKGSKKDMGEFKEALKNAISSRKGKAYAAQ